MINNGLFSAPRFDDPEYYLASGPRTEVTPAIRELAENAKGDTDKELALDMLKVMNKATPYHSLYLQYDNRQFKKSADEILKDGQRNWFFDSATLYTALLRARGIPAMQILTFSVKPAVNDPLEFMSGYIFVAAHLKDEQGNASWQVTEPHVDDYTIAWNRIGFRPFDLEDRNIDDQEYAFAYARDYADFDYKRRRITSKQMMVDLSRLAFGWSNKRDMTYVKELIAESEAKKREEAERKAAEEKIINQDDDIDR